MKNWIRTGLIAAAALAAAAPAALATTNADAVIALHVATASVKSPCSTVLPECRQVDTSAPLGTFNVYLFIGNHSDSLGTAGLQCGLQYDGTPGVGVDINSWMLCADIDFPLNWPDAGSWNSILWSYLANCQMGPDPAVAGVFLVTAYSPDCLMVIPRPVDGKAKVVNCENKETDLTGLTPSHLGYVCFGGGEGYNPCSLIVAVQPATWGSIKTLYQ